MKLRALLVDDEVNIARNLLQVISWNEIGFETVDYVTSGRKALEYIEENTPDLILCDIRMPIMDGISLLEHISELNLHCQVIMLTGYQDFDYVRSAMKLGARDYVLKPINYEELEKTIVKLVHEIHCDNEERIRQEKKWSKVVHLAYEKLLYDVLLDYTTVNTRHFMFDDEHKPEEIEYTLLLVDLDEYSLLARHWNDQERKLKNFAVKNVLQDALYPHDIEYAVLQMREGEWCVLIQHRLGAAPFGLEQSRVCSLALQQAVDKHVKLSVSVGVYPQQVSILRLSDTYKNVQRSLQLSPNNHQVLMTEDTEENDDLQLSLWSLIEKIVSSLRQHDRIKVEQSLDELKSSLKAISGQSMLRVAQILHFLILHLLREMREIHIISDAEEAATWSKLERSLGVKDLLDLIQQLLQDSMSTGLNKKPSEMLMLSAKEYIDKHLSSDFGVEEVSDRLGISCSYFSLLFKQYYGETFLEYVTKQRITLAKQMLVMSDKNVTQIGKIVGYAERRYFSKVFYKFTGMTPTEYRKDKANA